MSKSILTPIPPIFSPTSPRLRGTRFSTRSKSLAEYRKKCKTIFSAKKSRFNGSFRLGYY